MSELIFLAQDEAADAAGGAWFGLNNVFWLTILIIFVLGIVAAFVRLRQKDKCLKLLEDYHVTYLGGEEEVPQRSANADAHLGGYRRGVGDSTTHRPLLPYHAYRSSPASHPHRTTCWVQCY